MNENVIYNRTFKNMLAVKDENGEDKLLPVINITELAKLMQFGQMAFYVSLLNTCRKWDSLNKSFSTENISLIDSKAKISSNDTGKLRKSIFKNGNPDTMELMCSISPVKNKPIRMNFLDIDYVGVKSERDVLWWVCHGTDHLKEFPKKNGTLPILISNGDKNWQNIKQNIQIFFERIKTENGDKKYTKDDFNFLNIFFESSEPEYNIPTDKNGYLTISDNNDIHKLNDAGRKILEVSINKLKIEDPVSIKAIEDELTSMAEYFSMLDVDDQFKELEKEDYIDEIKNQLCGRFDRIGLNSSILGKDLLPKEAYDYANSGHIHYFMLYVYTCLLPYVLEIFEKGVDATLKKRNLVIGRVLKIINDFREKSLQKKYSSLKSISSIICDPEIFKICDSKTFEEFAEKINDMAMIFHNAMFAGEVKTVTRQGGTHYQITQFDFVCLDLFERTYADGFCLNGEFGIPVPKLFKHYAIEANLPKSINGGNQQIPDKFEWFKFPCKISELGSSELNELEPEQVIENIKIFSYFQIREFKIKNIINVFECVCAPQNNYTEYDKQNVFSRFFSLVDIIAYLSAEQILNWQNYIPASNLENDGYKLSKDKKIKLAGYINENKFSSEYEKAFFISLSRRNDRIDIYKVILPKKIIDNQDSINFIDLFNFDETDFQTNLFNYVHENLKDDNIKKFIAKEYISDLYFKIYDMEINEIYNLFYTDNDYNFKYKFFPKYKAKELIIFMEENNTPKDISQRLKIYTSQKYLFNEFLNYIFGKEEDGQLLNIVVNKMNAEPKLISWLSCEQILKFVNFYLVVMQKTESNRFFELCKTHLKNDEFFKYVAKNISNFSPNLLKFFPETLNYLSCEEIWNLQEELTDNEILTFAKNFDRFYELTDYFFKEGKNINLLRAILRQNQSLIKQIIYWPKRVICRPEKQISEDEPITFFYINNITPEKGNAGHSKTILYTTKKRIYEILCKTKFFYKLILNAEEKFDEDFISVIKQDINVCDLNLIFFAFEYKYGIDNVPENYKLLLLHFVDNFDLENSSIEAFELKWFLPFAEFYFNFTEENEEKFVSILKVLINKNLHVLKYFLSDDENERLNLKKEIFHYTRDFTESESTKLFVAYCREKIKNDITINLSVEQIFKLWEIGKDNEPNKMLMDFFLNANANDEYLHSIPEIKKIILTDMLKYDDRLVKKLAATGNMGILRLFTPEQIVIANEYISKESFKNFSSDEIHNLVDYILDNDIKINFSFFEKIIYAISGKFDSNYVIDRSKRKKLEKLFEKVWDASKDEKLNCFMTLYNGYCFLSGSHVIIPSSPNFNKHDAVWFINSIFDSSFKFADISINDFFKKVPKAKESYLEPIKAKCNGLNLFLLIVDGLCPLPVMYYSVIAVMGFVMGVTSLGTFLGLLIASVVLLSNFGYFLIRFAKNKIKLRRINHASSNNQKLNSESHDQSLQTENNIENQEQHRQNQYLQPLFFQQQVDQLQTEQPAEQPPEVPPQTEVPR